MSWPTLYNRLTLTLPCVVMWVFRSVVRSTMIILSYLQVATTAVILNSHVIHLSTIHTTTVFFTAGLRCCTLLPKTPANFRQV